MEGPALRHAEVPISRVVDQAARFRIDLGFGLSIVSNLQNGREHHNDRDLDGRHPPGHHPGAGRRQTTRPGPRGPRYPGGGYPKDRRRSPSVRRGGTTVRGTAKRLSEVLLRWCESERVLFHPTVSPLVSNGLCDSDENGDKFVLVRDGTPPRKLEVRPCEVPIGDTLCAFSNGRFLGGDRS